MSRSGQGRIGRRPGQVGVTLLEMLVAVSILGVIAALMYGTFSRSLATRDYVTSRARLFTTARTALDGIERDLMGSFVSGRYPFGAARFFSTGKADEDSLASDLPLLDVTAVSARGTTPLEVGSFLPESHDDRGEQARILYRLEKVDVPGTAGASELALVRYEVRPPGPIDFATASRSVVVRGVESVSLQFADGATWHEDWDSAAPGIERGALPIAIRSQLTLASDDGRPLTLVSGIVLAQGGRHG
jgi:prepilin-type N-terminal cleavage/methylation domain-containing protein